MTFTEKTIEEYKKIRKNADQRGLTYIMSIQLAEEITLDALAKQKEKILKAVERMKRNEVKWVPVEGVTCTFSAPDVEDYSFNEALSQVREAIEKV